MIISTPHIIADENDFAKTVLMPGDPLRARYIAENFLVDAKLVNNLRGIQGYTGKYNGKKVSVMASGMGMPSIAIYSYELYKFFGVDNIIRIGTAGAMQPNVNVRDLIIATGSYTDSSIIKNTIAEDINYLTSSKELTEKAIKLAKDGNINYKAGDVLSSDIFYTDIPTYNSEWAKKGVLSAEMESAALYMNAKRLNKNALTLLTVSNSVFSENGSLSGEERQNSLNEMITLALNIATE